MAKILRAGPWWSGTNANPIVGGGPINVVADPQGPPFNAAPVNRANLNWGSSSEQSKLWGARVVRGDDNTDDAVGLINFDQPAATSTADSVFLQIQFYWQATSPFRILQTLSVYGDSGFGDWTVAYETIEGGSNFFFETIGGEDLGKTKIFPFPETTLGHAYFYMSVSSSDPDQRLITKLEKSA